VIFLTTSIAGLFTALQTKIIACGTKKMLLSLSIRFFLGPALMVISSYAVGMRGILLKVAIVQVIFTPLFHLTSVHVATRTNTKNYA
jgi:auxin efflux carrier family